MVLWPGMNAHKRKWEFACIRGQMGIHLTHVADSSGPVGQTIVVCGLRGPGAPPGWQTTKNDRLPHNGFCLGFNNPKPEFPPDPA